MTLRESMEEAPLEEALVAMAAREAAPKVAVRA